MAVVHYPAVGRPERPIISVCIANYNGENLLADCIDSVLAQRGGDGVEIIVHDDASTDGSVAWMREHYPQVELLASGKNVGFCVGNNRMVEHARGEFVLLLNNDAALFPDALAVLLEGARAQAMPGILTLPQYDWQTAALVDCGCLLDPFYNPVPNLDLERGDIAYVIGACLWIPRALWQELGGLPEWIGSIGEDMYLCCLARLRGLPVRALSGSGYRHRQGASFGGNRVQTEQLQTTFQRRRLSERNKTAVLLICTPTALAWPLLALHLLTLALEGSAMTVARRDTRVWREIYAPAIHFAFSDLVRMRELRRQVQSRRRIALGDYLDMFVPTLRKLVLLRRHGVPKIS